MNNNNANRFDPEFYDKRLTVIIRSLPLGYLICFSFAAIAMNWQFVSPSLLFSVICAVVQIVCVFIMRRLDADLFMIEQKKIILGAVICLLSGALLLFDTHWLDVLSRILIAVGFTAAMMRIDFYYQWIDRTVSEESEEE